MFAIATTKSRKTDAEGKARLDQFDGYVEARSRLQELQGRARRLEEELTMPVDNTGEDARKLLAGERIEYRNATAIEAELKVVRRAVGMAIAEVQRQKQLAIAEIVPTVRPTHQARIQGLFDAVKAARQALETLSAAEAALFAQELLGPVPSGFSNHGFASGTLRKALLAINFSEWQRDLQDRGYNI